MEAENIPFHQKARIEDPFKRFPGRIKYETSPGCRAVEFRTAEDMNAFFTENNGAVAVHVSAQPNHIFCLYTIQLTDEEIEILNIRAEIVNRMVEEEREKREAAKQAEIDQLEKEEEERKRLVVKGKKCEHDHGGLEKIKEENGKLRKLARKNGWKMDDEVTE